MTLQWVFVLKKRKTHSKKEFLMSGKIAMKKKKM